MAAEKAERRRELEIELGQLRAQLRTGKMKRILIESYHFRLWSKRMLLNYNENLHAENYNALVLLELQQLSVPNRIM